MPSATCNHYQAITKKDERSARRATSKPVHMPYTTASKLPNQKTSIFSVMSAMAKEENALNLSQGFPDFGIDTQLIEYLHEGMINGHNQYAPMAGLPILRKQIASKTKKLHGRVYDVDDEITVVPGATLGIFAVISAVVKGGDEVIIFDPAYDSYQPSIELNGGIPIQIPLSFPDFSIDWNRVKNALSERTKLIIINSPHNPSGSILHQQDLDALRELVQDTKILILSDEVYEHIIFDGHKHISLAKDTGLSERTFITSSFGKTYHTTGWKMGYVLAPKHLTKVLREGYQFMAFSAHTPTQYAFAKMLEDESTYLNLGKFYQKKRDLFRELVKDSRFEILPTDGSYFQLLSFRNISQESDVDFAERLTRQHKLASIPISVFYKDNIDHKVLRFCFAKKNETLIKAAEILCQI